MHFDLATEYAVSDAVRSPAGYGHYSSVAPTAIVSIKGPNSPAVYFFACRTPSYGSAALAEVEVSLKTRELATATSRWQKNVLNRTAPDDVDSLTETVDAVMEVIVGVGPYALSLVGLNPSVVHAEHLAAVLRASSSWRDEVPGWDEALHVAKAAAVGSNLDVDDVLFGLG